jgi:hypothetical protein
VAGTPEDAHTIYSRPQPPQLDADMLVHDIVDELRRLKFDGDKSKNGFSRSRLTGTSEIPGDHTGPRRGKFSG